MATPEDIQLTKEEKDKINQYLKIFKAFDEMHYDGNPYDAEEVTNYLCDVSSTKMMLKEMYKNIPECVKHIIPNIHEY